GDRGRGAGARLQDSRRGLRVPVRANPRQRLSPGTYDSRGARAGDLISDKTRLEHYLAECWEELEANDSSLAGYKLLGRMEDVSWTPPRLTFTIERHGRHGHGINQG